MRIIHVLNHFLPDQIAGTEVYVWTLCKDQLNRNHYASVLIPNYDVDKDEQYIFDGIQVYKYAEPSKKDRGLISGQRVPDGLKAFTLYIELQKPQIVHFHEIAGSNGITISHFEALKESGAKIIYTIHLPSVTCRAGTLMLKKKKLCDGLIIENRCSNCMLVHKTNNCLKAYLLTKLGNVLSGMGIDPIKWQNSIGTALSYPYQVKKLKRDLKRIVLNCDMIIPITNFYYNILLKNGVPTEKMLMIPQALITVPHSNTTAEIKKNLPLPLRLIFVGRIDPIKGIQLLTEAVKQFKPEQVSLDIFGNITDAYFFKKCKESTASSTHIRWMGQLRKEEVVITMKQYDALVLPSLFSEMSPLVVQEAFAAGIPVIGSNVYGIAEQVQDGVNGLLFKFGDSNSLKAAVQKILNNPNLTRTLSTNIKPVRHFEDVTDETLRVYETIISCNRTLI